MFLCGSRLVTRHARERPSGRGRVPLRPGDCVKIGHTSLTFAIQQAGVSKPLRCEPDSESSDDDSEPRKKPSLLKDMMRSTLSGITAKKELGIDSDQQDIDLKKAEKDTTALEGVGSKDERMKRLNAMRRSAVGEAEESTEHMGDMGSGPLLQIFKLAKRATARWTGPALAPQRPKRTVLRLPGHAGPRFSEGREEAV